MLGYGRVVMTLESAPDWVFCQSARQCFEQCCGSVILGLAGYSTFRTIHLLRTDLRASRFPGMGQFLHVASLSLCGTW